MIACFAARPGDVRRMPRTPRRQGCAGLQEGVQAVFFMSLLSARVGHFFEAARIQDRLAKRGSSDGGYTRDRSATPIRQVRTAGAGIRRRGTRAADLGPAVTRAAARTRIFEPSGSTASRSALRPVEDLGSQRLPAAGRGRKRRVGPLRRPRRLPHPTQTLTSMFVSASTLPGTAHVRS
jgi:hypothetical protein